MRRQAGIKQKMLLLLIALLAVTITSLPSARANGS